jgi:methylmalonyl-CoA/ethylmalonyl-CoA epimerase
MDFSKLVLDHIAVAVNSLDQSKKIYQALGLTFSEHIEEVTSQQVRVAFAELDTHAKLELLEPTSSESTIYKFIEKKGEGIHHLSFRVDDIKKKSQELLDQGFKLIYSEAQPGANNCLVNFIHPKSANGVLIELSQAKTLE